MTLHILPIRLEPGRDLRLSLEQLLAEEQEQAGCVICGIGSLERLQLRLAGRDTLTSLTGDLEILSLSGTLAANGSHLHISVADANGNVCGGHLALGSTVRTTAEVIVGLLPQWQFSRSRDALSGTRELQIRPRG